MASIEGLRHSVSQKLDRFNAWLSQTAEMPPTTYTPQELARLQFCAEGTVTPTDRKNFIKHSADQAAWVHALPFRVSLHKNHQRK